MKNLIDQFKARFCAPKAIKLSELLSDFYANHFFEVHNFFLSPSSSLQGSQMLEAHVKATRKDWNYGGYIFVAASRANEVLRILDRQGIVPIVTRYASESEMRLFINVLRNDAQQVRVYIEDDSLPDKMQIERFDFIQKIITDQLKMTWTHQSELNMSNSEYSDLLYRINPKGVNYNEMANRPESPSATIDVDHRLPIVFDLDHQTRKGFSVVMAMAHRILSFCVISHLDKFHYQVDGIYSPKHFCEDEHQLMLTNCVSIYGSGRIRHKELSELYARRSKEIMKIEKPYGKVMARMSDHLDMEDFYQESNQGVVFFGREVPTLVDLSK